MLLRVFLLHPVPTTFPWLFFRRDSAVCLNCGQAIHFVQKSYKYKDRSDSQRPNFVRDGKTPWKSLPPSDCDLVTHHKFWNERQQKYGTFDEVEANSAKMMKEGFEDHKLRTWPNQDSQASKMMKPSSPFQFLPLIRIHAFFTPWRMILLFN